MSERAILSGDIIYDESTIGLVICSQKAYSSVGGEYFRVLFFNSEKSKIDLTCIFSNSGRSMWTKL